MGRPTIPNVSIAWCHRVARCKWCENDIVAGTPMVSVFFWNKGNEEKRGWNSKYYYHPDCWVSQGLDYLDRNPYVPYPGRKRVEMEPEMKSKRLKILRRKASLEQRRRNTEDPLMLAHIETQIAGLLPEIAEAGGIPKSWLETL